MPRCTSKSWVWPPRQRAPVSTRFGFPSITSPTTSSPLRRRWCCRGWPVRPSGSSSVRWSPFFPGTTRCEWRRATRCWTICRAGGPSPGWAAASAAIEFNNFRVEMGESRRRFAEYSEAILEALETGYIEHHGELYQQPRTAIRPRPLASFKGRTLRGGGIAGVHRTDGPHGGRDTRDRPEAVGDGRGRAGRTIVNVSAQLNGHEAPKPVLVLVVGREPGPEDGAADARRLPSALGTIHRRALRVRQSRVRRRSRGTSTTAPWPTTSPSTGWSGSTAFWPTCRCGARPTR